MIPINCQCKSCNLKYTYNFDDESLCQICFMKALNNKEINYVKEKIDNLNKRKESKWYEIKKFSYYSLFLLPILFYVGIKYGLITQILFSTTMILSTLLDPLSEWLADRF